MVNRLAQLKRKRDRDIAPRECRDWVKGARCSSKDAPNPNHSRCLECGSRPAVCDSKQRRG